jgi:hypothetical protein
MSKPSDIIVTTPKKEIENAALEAKVCREAGGGFYFRTFSKRPKGLKFGSRIFYVEDGYIRGYALVSQIKEGEMQCSVTKKQYGEGYHAIMKADSWTWIKPIAMKGFQGWKPMPLEMELNIEIIGGWLDPRPEIEQNAAAV